MSIYRNLLLWLLVLIFAGTNVAHAIEGIVVNAKTHAPIAGAVVRTADQEVRTDEKGHFQIADKSATMSGKSVSARAQGYLRKTTKVDDVTETITIALTAFQPKALYLSAYGIGSSIGPATTSAPSGLGRSSSSTGICCCAAASSTSPSEVS